MIGAWMAGSRNGRKASAPCRQPAPRSSSCSGRAAPADRLPRRTARGPHRTPPRRASAACSATGSSSPCTPTDRAVECQRGRVARGALERLAPAITKPMPGAPRCTCPRPRPARRTRPCARRSQGRRTSSSRRSAGDARGARPLRRSLERIVDPRRGLAVDEADVCDRAVAGEQPVDVRGHCRYVVGGDKGRDRRPSSSRAWHAVAVAPLISTSR